MNSRVKPAVPPDERERLARLRGYAILDSEPEQGFDDLVQLAAHLFGAPMAFVSLVDAERQWFKAKVGLEACETSRDVAFCAHAILEREPLVVPDARLDPRFAANELVTGEPHIRFYVGAPLLAGVGSALGTLCVIDTVARAADPASVTMLQKLAAMVVDRLELRRKLEELRVALAARDAADAARECTVLELQTALDRVRQLEGLLPICSGCRQIRDDQGSWRVLEHYLVARGAARFTHSICPACVQVLYPDLGN
jgi:GAF domain-containing protein